MSKDGIIDRIQHLGPFGYLHIEVLEGLPEYNELCDVIPFKEMRLGVLSTIECSKYNVRFSVLRNNEAEYDIGIHKYPDGVLGLH